jgi:hypothetical protein
MVNAVEHFRHLQSRTSGMSATISTSSARQSGHTIGGSHLAILNGPHHIVTSNKGRASMLP